MGKLISLRKHKIGKFKKLCVWIDREFLLRSENNHFSCYTRNPIKVIAKMRQRSIVRVQYDGKKIY